MKQTNYTRHKKQINIIFAMKMMKKRSITRTSLFYSTVVIARLLAECTWYYAK
jgi:hypothetical protein